VLCHRNTPMVPARQQFQTLDRKRKGHA
jgi:hypothetical protein